MKDRIEKIQEDIDRIQEKIDELNWKIEGVNIEPEIIEKFGQIINQTEINEWHVKSEEKKQTEIEEYKNEIAKWEIKLKEKKEYLAKTKKLQESIKVFKNIIKEEKKLMQNKSFDEHDKGEQNG
jgi:predicted RNase H-like nuclease (RuvC/YqgF family)